MGVCGSLDALLLLAVATLQTNNFRHEQVEVKLESRNVVVMFNDFFLASLMFLSLSAVSTCSRGLFEARKPPGQNHLHSPSIKLHESGEPGIEDTAVAIISVMTFAS